MTGLKQRLLRRRTAGSSGRGAPGLKSRLPGFLRPGSGGSKAQRLPWGKRAAAQPAAPLAADGAVAQPAAALGAQAAVATEVAATGGSASFRDRGRLRRRLRFLRRARELAFRDVGGLVFDMRRFGRERPDLVEAKLAALTAVDQELRALERVLDERRPIHELREPGLSSCQRCGALHASEDHFCPRCGLQFGGPQAMGEVGGAIAAPPQAPAPPAGQPTAATLIAPGAAPVSVPPAAAPQTAAPSDWRTAPGHPADAQQTEILRPPDAP